MGSNIWFSGCSTIRRPVLGGMGGGVSDVVGRIGFVGDNQDFRGVVLGASSRLQFFWSFLEVVMIKGGQVLELYRLLKPGRTLARRGKDE